MQAITLVVTVLCITACYGDVSKIEAVDKLTKQNLLQGAADVVFLLDRSGSVGHANFELMKGFVESLLMQVVVDANATRVAVISYSTTVKLHINYIRNPKSKCFFALEMQDVTYDDVGATDIGAALEEARLVLHDARADVNKVVILISDGKATRGSNPIPIAKRLKKETGAEVFAFGIGRFLETQLKRIATSPEHTYACPGFREFRRLARSIRGDPHESKWSNLISETPSCDHLCNSPYRGEPDDPGCCDHHAKCSCALLSGTHTCVCLPGYYGLSGTWNKCTACPKGTYKARMEPSSDCTQCPPHATTSKVASTSFKDCQCKEGYSGKPSEGIPCEVVRCPPLQDPTHGAIVNRCENRFSSTCYFMCENGYELADPNSESLTCQSDGRWSNDLPVCRKIQCRYPFPPDYGSVQCDQRDLFIGTVCRFSCSLGFLLKGSPMRQCLPSKSWSGFEPSCIAITCPIPRPLYDGTIINCGSEDKPTYGTTCIFRCNVGFKLIGPEMVTCDEHGNLVETMGHKRYSNNPPYCQDVQPPEIRCPEPLEIPTAAGNSFALLHVQAPLASDNSGMVLRVTSHPPLPQSPVKFSIGKTHIVFQAEDFSRLVGECTFTVVVTDNEPPKVINCPSTITVNTSDNNVRVFWEEPMFHDNSQLLAGVKSNSKPGASFTVGRHTIAYLAADLSNNVASCTFDVIVTQNECPYYAPPINGALACEVWMYGQICQTYCNDKYEFAYKPAEWYVCNDEADWETIPEGYPMPWPDCLGKRLPFGIRHMLHGYYYSGDCNDPRVQNAIRKVFLHHFKKQFPEQQYCKKNTSCILEMIKVKCGASSPEAPSPLPHPRFRRDLGLETSSMHGFDIELDIMIDDSMSDKDFDELLNSFENFDWEVDDEMYEELASFNPDFHKVDLIFETINNSVQITSKQVEILCPRGAILSDQMCMLCQPGTFHNPSTNECEDCPIGYYQEADGQTECLACPENTTTVATNTRNKTDCKGFCMKGTYSPNGLQTCIACPIGTFQDEIRKTSCISCPNGTITSTDSSSSAKDCQYPCSPGTVSALGLEPCEPCPLGFYQAYAGQTFCEECPSNYTTLTRGSKFATDCLDYDQCIRDSPCDHGGNCLTINHEAFCQCTEGFTGKFCEHDVDECTNSPCLNGGSCINLIASFYCVCGLGFRGDLCEEEIDECLSAPCLNNGTCVDQYGSYLCICTESYGGLNCEDHYPVCSNGIICLNGGYCSESDGTAPGECVCPSAFTGPDCSLKLNRCHQFTCLNGGSCIDDIEGFSCICALGYTGKFCELDIDECAHHECHGGATCMDLVGRYECQCPHEWGGKLCDQKLSSDFILSYPEESSLSNMAYSTLNSSLSEGTLSMWVQTKDVHRLSSTPMSYSTYSSTTFAKNGSSGYLQGSLEIDNALTVSDTADISFYINNQPIYLGVNASDGKWHHLGFTWSGNDTSGEWNFYKDGKLVSSDKDFQHNLIVPAGGQIIVGQEQDKVGGGFNSAESYSGNITRLNIWDKCLPSTVIANLCKLQDDIPGKVVAWTDFRGTVSGNVQVLENMKPEI